MGRPNLYDDAFTFEDAPAGFREPAVAVYPDSDKIGIWPGRDGDDLMVRREDGRRDHWDREGGG